MLNWFMPSNISQGIYPKGINVRKGSKFSKESKRKVSEALKGHGVSEQTKRKISKANKGKKRSGEFRQRMSKIQKGRKLPEDTKRKISKTKKGVKLSKEHCKKLSKVRKGIKLSEETKRKMSENLRGKKGSEARNWKGGKKKNGGYITIFSPTHPYANKRKYVLEHRLIMEKHTGRVLLPTEVVHHINGIKNDNRIENLMLFSNHREHMGLHRKQRRKRHHPQYLA